MRSQSVCHLEGAGHNRQDEAVSPDPNHRSKATGARHAVAGLTGLAAAAVAISIAVTGNDPVGSAPRDPVPIGGAVVLPTAPTVTTPQTLPPLALLLEEPLPPRLARLTGSEQLRALERRAAHGPASARLQYAAAEQRTGHQQVARREYRAVLATDPTDMAARTGLILARAVASPAALRESGRTMARLARANPTSQLVAINQGWLAVYRNDRPTAITAWRRAAKLRPNTRLGRSASGALGKLAPSPNP